MSEDKTGKNAALIGGIALIAVGVWFLTRGALLPWLEPLREAWDRVHQIGWPAAVIIAGVALVALSSRSGFKAPAPGTRLYRSRTKKMLGGVMGGLSDYLDVDVTWLRLGYALLAVLTDVGPLLLVYIVASVIIPKEPEPAVAGAHVPQQAGAVPPPPPPPPPPAQG